MSLEDQVIRDAPEGSFFVTGGVRGIGRSSFTPLGIANALTVAAWVRVDSVPSIGNTADIVRLTSVNNSQNQIALQVVNVAGQVHFQWTVSSVLNSRTQTGDTNIVTGRWYHVLGCKNDTFSMRLFVNGLDDTSIIVSPNVPSTVDASRRISIGYDIRGINSNFNGAVGSVALWSTALSEEGVKSIYSGGWRDLDLRIAHACYSESPSLVHWWRLGQGEQDNSVGDEIISDWSLSGGLTLPTRLGTVTQQHIMVPGLSSNGSSAFFGPSDALSSPVALPIGISNEFSISIWVKPEDVDTAFQTLMYIGPQAPSQTSAIDISIGGTISGDPLRLVARNSAGSIAQEIDFDGVLEEGEWQHLLLVFNSSNFPESWKLYLNGIKQVGVVNSGSMAGPLDQSRFLEIGGSVRNVSADTDFVGQIGHVGIWDKELSQNEARFIFSQGYCVDLRYNDSVYQSAENLKHYYKFGEDLTTKSRDFMDTQTSSFVNPLTSETGNVEIIGDYPGAIEILPSEIISGALKSVSLDGVSEAFKNTSTNPIGIADSWTISFWAKSDNSVFPSANPRSLVQIQVDSVTAANRIQLYSNNQGGLVVENFGTGGGLINFEIYNNFYTDELWNHAVVAWNGTSISVWRNGSPVSPDSALGGSGTMADSPDRRIRYGEMDVNFGTFDNWQGNLGHVAIWNSVLSNLAVLEVFNGNHSIDLTVNQGNYSNSSQLVHWWRPGFSDPGFTDEGVTVGTRVDFSDSVGIDASDVVNDAPPN